MCYVALELRVQVQERTIVTCPKVDGIDCLTRRNRHIKDRRGGEPVQNSKQVCGWWRAMESGIDKRGKRVKVREEARLEVIFCSVVDGSRNEERTRAQKFEGEQDKTPGLVVACRLQCVSARFIWDQHPQGPEGLTHLQGSNFKCV